MCHGRLAAGADPTPADKPSLAAARLTILVTLTEGLALNIVTNFRKKVFSLHDITPRVGSDDGGDNHQPFILAGKWPSSAAKRPSRAAKWPSWGAKWLSSCALLKTARRLILGGCAVPVMVYVNCAHIGVFYNRGRYNALYLQTTSRVTRKTQVLEFRHNSTKGRENLGVT